MKVVENEQTGTRHILDSVHSKHDNWYAFTAVCGFYVEGERVEDDFIEDNIQWFGTEPDECLNCARHLKHD